MRTYFIAFSHQRGASSGFGNVSMRLAPITTLDEVNAISRHIAGGIGVDSVVVLSWQAFETVGSEPGE